MSRYAKAGRRAADAIDRWTRAWHAPFDISGVGDGPMVCRHCRVDWPCEELVRVNDRLASRFIAYGRPAK